ncbi:hypothetical protein BSK59_16220 [Paenibacillus odorifer]|uniref:hypothetical protein n=1 Tax=Paenibacillus odorifer TaxID=189426 RepID=UPI00096DAD64|nr:hypothetical protein [Paenibacillus odorifer]OME54125.1 hypothetical protein BSK59_16220 [Paenibacillus odorifer]
MSKVRKTGHTSLTEEQIAKIRVDPEDTAKRLASLPYTITPRPEGKAPRGHFWCPYEAKWSDFIQNHPTSPMSNYYRCETCGISTEDYYVKTVNRLWGDKEERN